MKKNKNKKLLKKWAGRLHLWLGLLTGLIVLIVALTGCIYVFHDEIKDALYDYRFVEEQKVDYLPPSEIKNIVQENYPGTTDDFVLYVGKDRPVAVYGVHEETLYYYYLNPYTGEFLYAQDFTKDFFEIVKALHMYLLLPQDIGRQVVGVSTIIFILMLITGIILWWPKKLKNLKKSLKIKWNARWRRLNYDLHNISGFYLHILALIVAITGLYFSYDWVKSGIYFVGNLGEDVQTDHHIEDIEQKERIPEEPIDIAFFETIKLAPENEMYFVWTEGDDHPVVTGAYPESLDYDHQANYYFHPQTAELLQEQTYASKSTGMKLQEMSYGIHTGQYFGLTGKIIAFILSLFVASLPISGFVIWWGRKNRMKHLTR
ncbi:PepSY-associated TM helix domain-containing protein [Christiangramia sp. SM2212]|uniref:PepSY-associated TM helix domain-containing protein n=1 Tax=Christiangramia sediminicola TaxID=3073267 RepID=A0ABU1ERW2_9FLAO|nr:PepSY-associated TM helix domain-containing protein [Christiangramia sp. SM2212]MDR5590724.1 PepSY-associated TM helix domain-containing protein [Christiangramia sp. SM2212]